MLSDREREELQDLERRLVADDPAFRRSFDDHAERLGSRRPGAGATTALVAAVLLAALMLLVGSPGGALAAAAATGLVWLAFRYGDGGWPGARDGPPGS